MVIKYFLAPPIIWIISQTIKTILRLTIRGEEFSWRHIRWIYEFGDGAPSTHSAMLVGMLYILASQGSINAVFGFAFATSLIFMYNLVENRKKQEILESYVRNSSDPAIRKLADDKKMMDISGHSYTEVGVGILVGLAMGFVLQTWFF